MRLTVLDANAEEQVVIAPGVESAVGTTGAIAATGVAQALLAANANRSGWVFQNQAVPQVEGQGIMWVNELGADASSNPGAGSFAVGPGQFFPPQGFPLSAAAVSITGTVGDKFTVREW